MNGLAPPDMAVMRRFVASVLALSEDASAQNLTTYLAASRALDESRRSIAPVNRYRTDK
jgi:hypothetical protein